MDCSMPGSSDLHCLPDFAQTIEFELKPWPLSQWWHPLISSSVALFSTCPQLFPASGSFPMCQHLASGGQIVGAAALASVPPVSIQGWSPLGLTGLICLASKRLSKSLLHPTVRRHPFFGAQPSSWSKPHIHTWLLEKPSLWLYRLLLAKWCLCFLVHCLGLS